MQVAAELADIAYQRNGKIDETQHEVQDFYASNFNQKQNKITQQCDIFSIGAIIFQLLLGQPPSQKTIKFINDNRLHENTPKGNVYKVPPFFKDYILSNDMIYIIVKLLCQDPNNRFQNIQDVRQQFVTLRQNIEQTPVILRQILGHPILPNENFFRNDDTELFPQLNQQINFRNSVMSEFSLKYLAKFLYEKRTNLLAINGGLMQLNTIKMNDIALLNLSNQGLYSEDFFILCQFLKQNNSITHINLSQNYIGYKKME